MLRILLPLVIIASCGGGGGGGGSTPTTPTAPAPSVSFSANPTSVIIGSESTLTWSSSNASSCSASGAWSGSRATSGSESVTISAVGNINFTLTCTGDGGSRSATVTIEGYRLTDGVVVDGYISGADVFIDENANFVADSTESSTTSDNEGKFTIKYSNGNLVSIGGTDLDTQTLLDNFLITHKLTGHSDFKAITPVTSVAAFMADASSVNAAFGIDSSIDVFTFDPVANKGDAGINDYLYEKGNQLTVLAFALQNIVNDLNGINENTQDYFKAIAEEVDAEFSNTSTKVDIETATFITNVVNNIINVKSITLDESIKANTIKALVGVLPIIQVQSNDDLTTALIRFGLSTLQNDIVNIANGTATEELITSYTSDILNYIAEDQNIDSNEITPDITAIADSASVEEDGSVTINVVANDSYTTTAPIGVSAGNGLNGSTMLAESSPEQVVYTPDADFNGTDTFTYTITQGDKTSSAEVEVTISAVNDSPSIEIASTIQVPENQTAITTVSLSDPDNEDELTLSLGGTDAASFNLSSDYVLSFKEAPDYETKTSYVITLTLTDGTETVTKDVTIIITNLNDVAPEFTSEETFSAAENQTAIGTVSATDAEGDIITFSISGSEVIINSSTGVIAFASAPDYETKSTFTATVTASDGINQTTQNIVINIIDIPDNPPIFGSTTYSVNERQTSIGLINVTDPDGDSLVLSISGQDSDAFILNSPFRSISFKNIPIYDEKNQYKTTIFATDGVYTVSKELVVNILEIPKEDTTHPQAIVGTSGNDVINGEDAQYDILIGLEGDDTLDGGENNSPVGGYHQDIYQFGDNSGNDIIKGFFIADNSKKDGKKIHDIIEVIKNVNDTGADSALDILNNSTENNGNAILNLGQGNTITIEGIALNQFKPEFILITYPYSNLIQGTNEDDVLAGTGEKNYRIEGSDDPMDRFEDGSDILKSSSGNDLMIGGTNDSPVGGFLLDRYEFFDDSGEDIIYGFYDPYNEFGRTENFRSDKILIPYNINGTAINSFNDLFSLAELTDDGWIKFNLGEGNNLTLHNIRSDEIYSDNIIFTFNDYTEIKGTSSSDFLYGTENNDWILGDERFMDRFQDGYDYLFSGNGNDILEGGESNSSTGGASYPNNYFIDGIGQKTIIGFSSIGHKDYNPFTKQTIDRLFIQKNTGINKVSDLDLTLTDDGFIKVVIDEDTSILLHGIKSQEVLTENFIVHDPIDQFIIGTEENDTLVGTAGNDLIDGYIERKISGCVGAASGHDILDGGFGNDVLIGGPSEHFCGGFNIDTFIFSDNSGIDQILDFTAEWELPGYVDDGSHRDILQIKKNINGLSITTASDIISRSSDNSDGFAEIDLGSGNKVTLIGKQLQNITPFHIRIVPEITNIITGLEGEENDILKGTDDNDYVKGSPYPNRRFEDGFDILDGGKGDDALDGGEYDSPFGGTIIDMYRFDKDYDNDIIFGFYAADIVDEGTQASPGIRSDKIEIPNDVVTSSSSLISNAENNNDGFAVLSFNGTTLTIHGIAKEQLKNDYFFIVPRVSNTITGNARGFQVDENDILIGTDGNDRINGSPIPFDRFEDGSDILDGGKGDDILNGGDADSPFGGYIYDRYRFNEDFGNDYVTTFSLDSSGSSNGDYEAQNSDRLEINNIYASTASEVIDSTSNNDDGWAVIQLGNNSITLFGISKQELKPDFFHIIPSIDNFITGNASGFQVDENDVLIGTDGNDYIEGSPIPFDRFSDGSDYLEGGKGDDVLIGGTNRNSAGWTEIDTYHFDDNSGNDLIIGFNVVFRTDYRDIIELKSNINNSGITDFNGVIENTTNNADGWAVIDLGENNSITLHGISKGNLTLAQENFQFF